MSIISMILLFIFVVRINLIRELPTLCILLLLMLS